MFRQSPKRRSSRITPSSLAFESSLRSKSNHNIAPPASTSQSSNSSIVTTSKSATPTRRNGFMAPTIASANRSSDYATVKRVPQRSKQQRPPNLPKGPKRLDFGTTISRVSKSYKTGQPARNQITDSGICDSDAEEVKILTEISNVQNSKATREHEQKPQELLSLNNQPSTSQQEISCTQAFLSAQEKIHSIDDFDIGRALGRGKFGSVYLVRHKSTKVISALKVLELAKLQKMNVLHLIQREVNIQTHLMHKNILSMSYAFYDSQRYYLVLQYARNGELYQKLKRHGGIFTEQQSAQYAGDIAHGLEYLHRLRIIHRDLKPENVLLDANDRCLLADFGWAVRLQHENSKRATFCGTMDYIAPEMIRHDVYTTKIDVWALGCMIYEFLVGQTPFFANTFEETSRRIIEMRFTRPLFDKMPDKARSLVKSILKELPAERPTASAIIENNWIADFASITNDEKLQ